MWLLLLTIVSIAAIYWSIEALIRKLMIKDISKKWVLVTGCDTGFGNVTAKRLDRMKVHVFAACLTVEGAKKLNEETTERVQAFVMDVSNHDSVLKGLQFVQENIPTGHEFWGLVNNAGIGGTFAPTEWLNVEDYQAVLNVNILGMIDVTNTFLPLLKKSRGRIVNTASVVGIVPTHWIGQYVMSKFAVVGWSGHLRLFLSACGYGVKVCTVEPGSFNTPLLDVSSLTARVQESFDGIQQELKEAYGFDFVDRLTKATRDMISKNAPSDKLYDVADAYIHGLFAIFPREHVALGPGAKFLLTLHWLLPTWMMDLCLTTFAHFPKPTVAVKTKKE